MAVGAASHRAMSKVSCPSDEWKAMGILHNCAVRHRTHYIFNRTVRKFSQSLCHSLPRHLSGVARCGQPDKYLVVYIYLYHAHAFDGAGVSDTRVVVFPGQDGDAQCRFYEAVPPSCLRRDCGYGSHHHAARHLHVLHGDDTDVRTLRAEHFDCGEGGLILLAVSWPGAVSRSEREKRIFPFTLPLMRTARQ